MGFLDRFRPQPDPEKLLAVLQERLSNSPTGNLDPRYALGERLPGGIGANQSHIRRLARSAAVMQHHKRMEIWLSLRQLLPTLDTAIENRRTLEGSICVHSDSARTKDLITEFVREVQVGYLGGAATQRGLDNYLSMLADGADTYGLSVGEIIWNGREIESLAVPNVRTLFTLKDAESGRVEIHQAVIGGNNSTRIDDKPWVQFCSFKASSEHPWPFPLAWCLFNSSEVSVRMLEAVSKAWERHGEPTMWHKIIFGDNQLPKMVSHKNEDGTVTSLPKVQVELEQSIRMINSAKAAGQYADVVTAANAVEMKSDSMHDVDASMQKFFTEHSDQFDGYIIAASKTPVWMYPSQTQMRSSGLGSNLAVNENAIAMAAAAKRTVHLERIARRVIDAFLLSAGKASQIGKYQISFDCVNIVDRVWMAEAAKMSEEAEAQRIENTFQLYDDDGNLRISGDALDYYLSNGGRIGH